MTAIGTKQRPYVFLPLNSDDTFFYLFSSVLLPYQVLLSVTLFFSFDSSSVSTFLLPHPLIQVLQHLTPIYASPSCALLPTPFTACHSSTPLTPSYSITLSLCIRHLSFLPSPSTLSLPSTGPSSLFHLVSSFHLISLSLCLLYLPRSLHPFHPRPWRIN